MSRGEAGLDAGATPAEPTVASAFALLLLIVGALGIAAAALLGDPVGDLLTPEPLGFWPQVSQWGLYRPEGHEFARYAALAAVPVLVAGAIAVAGSRSIPASLARPSRLAARILPLAVAAALIAAWLARSEPTPLPGDPNNYFSAAESLLGIALGVAATAAIASPGIRARLEAWAANRRAGAFSWALAGLATALLLLPALFTGKALPAAPEFLGFHLPYYFSDYAAVGAGLTPLVDHANHYAHLLPFALSPLLEAVDFAPGDFTVLMTALSALTLLLVFRTLVLVTRAELAGLALFLPVLGLSLIPIAEEEGGIVYIANMYPVLPERYIGPVVVLWLTARHLRHRRPRRPAVIFLAAGLALFNNPEFGVPCLLGALAALSAASLPGPPAPLRRLGLEALAGLAAAFVAVAAVTLIRAGSLPDPGVLLYFSRLFGLQGFGMAPMPVLGIWWALYASFGGALIYAALRSSRQEGDRALTGMLAFAGAFGLAAGAYYVGRSDKYTMTALFPIWALALALLGWQVLRSRVATHPAGGWRAFAAAGPLGLAAIVGLGIGMTRFAGPPLPWEEAERLTTSASGATRFELTESVRFVAAHAAEDEPVAILRENSDLIARDAGARNVSPLSEPFHIAASEQLDFVLERLEAEGGKAVYTGAVEIFAGNREFLDLWDGIEESLRARGYRPVARSATGALTKWLPRALG